MSKKVVAFTLPESRTYQSGVQSADPMETLSRLNAEAWIGTEAADAAPKPQPSREERQALLSGPSVIDLSAKRSFPELMELICVFPWLASYAWWLQASQAMLTSARPASSDQGPTGL